MAMKKVIVEMTDKTRSEIIERVSLDNLGELGDGVKDIVESFVKMNHGTVAPPVSIRITALPEAPDPISQSAPE